MESRNLTAPTKSNVVKMATSAQTGNTTSSEVDSMATRALTGLHTSYREAAYQCSKVKSEFKQKTKKQNKNQKKYKKQNKNQKIYKKQEKRNTQFLPSIPRPQKIVRVPPNHGEAFRNYELHGEIEISKKYTKMKKARPVKAAFQSPPPATSKRIISTKKWGLIECNLSYDGNFYVSIFKESHVVASYCGLHPTRCPFNLKLITPEEISFIKVTCQGFSARVEEYRRQLIADRCESSVPLPRTHEELKDPPSTSDVEGLLKHISNISYDSVKQRFIDALVENECSRFTRFIGRKVASEFIGKAAEQEESAIRFGYCLLAIKWAKTDHKLQEFPADELLATFERYSSMEWKGDRDYLYEWATERIAARISLSKPVIRQFTSIFFRFSDTSIRLIFTGLLYTNRTSGIDIDIYAQDVNPELVVLSKEERKMIKSKKERLSYSKFLVTSDPQGDVETKYHQFLHRDLHPMARASAPRLSSPVQTQVAADEASDVQRVLGGVKRLASGETSDSMVSVATKIISFIATAVNHTSWKDVTLCLINTAVQNYSQEIGIFTRDSVMRAMQSLTEQEFDSEETIDITSLSNIRDWVANGATALKPKEKGGVAIIGHLTKFVAYILTPHAGVCPEIVASWIRKEGSLDLKDFGEMITESFTFVIKITEMVATGMGFSAILKTLISPTSIYADVSEMKIQIGSYINGEFADHFPGKDPEEVYAKLVKTTESVEKMLLHRVIKESQMPVFSAYYRTLSQLILDYKNYEKMNQPRKMGVFIGVASSPGVGKGDVIARIKKSIECVRGRPFRDHECVTIQSDDTYLNNINPGHIFAHVPEIANKKAVKGDPEFVGNLTKHCDRSVSPLMSAVAEKKSTRGMGIKYFVGDSNDFVFGMDEKVNCLSAVFRRMECIEIVVKKEFAKMNNEKCWVPDGKKIQAYKEQYGTEPEIHLGRFYTLSQDMGAHGYKEPTEVFKELSDPAPKALGDGNMLSVNPKVAGFRRIALGGWKPLQEIMAELGQKLRTHDEEERIVLARTNERDSARTCTRCTNVESLCCCRSGPRFSMIGPLVDADELTERQLQTILENDVLDESEALSFSKAFESLPRKFVSLSGFVGFILHLDRFNIMAGRRVWTRKLAVRVFEMYTSGWTITAYVLVSFAFPGFVLTLMCFPISTLIAATTGGLYLSMAVVNGLAGICNVLLRSCRPDLQMIGRAGLKHQRAIAALGTMFIMGSIVRRFTSSGEKRTKEFDWASPRTDFFRQKDGSEDMPEGKLEPSNPSEVAERFSEPSPWLSPVMRQNPFVGKSKTMTKEHRVSRALSNMVTVLADGKRFEGAYISSTIIMGVWHEFDFPSTVTLLFGKGTEGGVLSQVISAVQCERKPDLWIFEVSQSRNRKDLVELMAKPNRSSRVFTFDREGNSYAMKVSHERVFKPDRPQVTGQKKYMIVPKRLNPHSDGDCGSLYFNTDGCIVGCHTGSREISGESIFIPIDPKEIGDMISKLADKGETVSVVPQFIGIEDFGRGMILEDSPGPRSSVNWTRHEGPEATEAAVSFEYYGTSPVSRITPKSKVLLSPISVALEANGLPRLHGAKNHHSGKAHSANIQIGARQKIPFALEDDLMAVDIFCDHVCPYIEATGIKIKVLTNNECALGVPGICKGIDKTRSAGTFFPGVKGDYMVPIEVDGMERWVFNDEMCSAVDFTIESWLQGKLVGLVGRTAVKDEPHPLAKMNKEDRLFIMCNPNFQFAAKRVLSFFQGAMRATPLQACTSEGIDAYSEEWHQLISHLKGFPHLIAGDFKKMDRTISCEDFDFMTRVLSRIVDEIGVHEDSEYSAAEIKTLLKMVFIECKNCFIQWDVDLISFCTNLSGWPFTVFTNGMAIIKDFIVMYAKLGNGRTFFQDCRLTTMGDDHWCTTVNEDFNQLLISRTYKERGVTYTDEFKNSEDVVRFADWDTSEFCKLRAQWNDDLGKWLAIPRVESVLKPLHTQMPSTENPMEIAMDACEVSLEKMARHGQKEFKIFRKKLNKTLEDINCAGFIPEIKKPWKYWFHRSTIRYSRVATAVPLEWDAISSISGSLSSVPTHDTAESLSLPRREAPEPHLITTDVLSAEGKGGVRSETKAPVKGVPPITEETNWHETHTEKTSKTMESDVMRISHEQEAPTSIQNTSRDQSAEAGHTQNTIQQVVNRTVKLRDVPWNVGVKDVTIFNPFEDMLKSRLIADRISHFRGARIKMKVTAVVTSNASHYGCLMMAYQPLHLKDSLAKFSPGVPQDMIELSQRQHVLMSAATSQSADIEIGFVFDKNYIDLTLDEHLQLGQVIVTPLVELQHVQDENSSLNVGIFGTITDIDLVQPTFSTGNFYDTAESGNDEYGTISGPAAKISAALSTLRHVPVIGKGAFATSLAAGAVSGIAKVFGFSAPRYLESEPTRVFTLGHIANCDVQQPHRSLGVLAKRENTIDPSTMFANDGDELLISKICSKESILGIFKFKKSDAPDTHLSSLEVTPFLGAEEDGLFHLTPSGYAALPFSYWRGTLAVRLRVVASGFHRGRLRVSWDPISSPDGKKYNTNYTEIIDVTSQTDVEFHVGWGAMATYLELPKELTELKGLSSVPVTASDTSNGVISVSVVNPLVSMKDDAVNEVSIIVSTRMMDDVEYSVPRDIISKIEYVKDLSIGSGSGSGTGGAFSSDVPGFNFKGDLTRSTFTLPPGLAMRYDLSGATFLGADDYAPGEYSSQVPPSQVDMLSTNTTGQTGHQYIVMANGNEGSMIPIAGGETKIGIAGFVNTPNPLTITTAGEAVGVNSAFNQEDELIFNNPGDWSVSSQARFLVTNVISDYFTGTIVSDDLFGFTTETGNPVGPSSGTITLNGNGDGTPRKYNFETEDWPGSYIELDVESGVFGIVQDPDGEAIFQPVIGIDGSPVEKRVSLFPFRKFSFYVIEPITISSIRYLTIADRVEVGMVSDGAYTSVASQAVRMGPRCDEDANMIHFGESVPSLRILGKRETEAYRAVCTADFPSGAIGIPMFPVGLSDGVVVSTPANVSSFPSYLEYLTRPFLCTRGSVRITVIAHGRESDDSYWRSVYAITRAGLDTDIAGYSGQEQLTTLSGTELSFLLSNDCLQVEIPWYSNKRFSYSRSNLTKDWIDYQLLLRTGKGAVNQQFSLLYSTGEDFTVAHWATTPLLRVAA